jgi:hypothetical protein
MEYFTHLEFLLVAAWGWDSWRDLQGLDSCEILLIEQMHREIGEMTRKETCCTETSC